MEGEVTRTKVISRGDEAAVTRWFEAASARDDARRQRLLDSRGTLPALLWIMLVIAAVSVALFVLLYADPSERALGQIAFAATVTAVMVSSLLAVALLSAPFQGGHGSVGPGDMRYTLTLIEEELGFLHHPTRCPVRRARSTARRVITWRGASAAGSACGPSASAPSRGAAHG